MDGSAPPVPTAAAIAASGDSLFRRYYRWLSASLRKEYGGDVADDVAAETFMRVAPYAADGRLRNPKALLMRVARNLIVDRKKHDRVAALTQPMDEDFFARLATPATQEEALALKQIVLALPPELRDVLVLKSIMGLSYQDIMDRLGLPYTTVNHRLREAYGLVLAALRPEQAR